MDRKVKVNLPPPPTDLQNKYPAHPLQGVSREPNLTSSSSSSSAAAPSPPDFLRHVQAVFKRHRPLATMPSNLSRARRVLVPQTGSSNQRKGLSGEEAEDSSLPPPPVTGTVTAVENVSSSAINASSASLKVETSSGNLTAVKGDDLKHEQLLVDPMTRCSVVGSSCAATTMSVHSGPTFQTAIATQMSSVDSKVSLGFRDQAPIDGRAIGMKGGDALDCKGKEAHNSDGEVKGKGVSGDISIGRKSSDQNVDFEPSQAAKGKKILRKKKHDPDLFFKVNGKLYQKLGKIGSGGSSEVYKVISSDCTIYALKQINLKGRDYATACGFCQEIGYLNNLKGNANIIQLIDYEVTDKILLEEVMNGCVTRKDCRIRDDEYIYMVLEYGEIDLAHMLSQKWKEMDASSYKIDENWLRFYWQQMLEAVNTIHEERIVHSDLKPANFLLVKGILRLIDFGIAKSITSDTTNIQRDAQVGTLNYMSPEAFIPNEQEADGNTIKFGRPSDIWSLGCILYQMVYGKTPFAEYKTFWAKFKVITDRSHEIVYQPLSNPWLIDLMKKCLAWERNERWRIPQLLQHPFLVPPLPRELPCAEDHAWKLFIEQIQVHWNEPQVTRLRNQFQELLANLEKRSTGQSI